MKSRRKDIRTARKSGPSASRNSMNISTRSLRAKRRKPESDGPSSAVPAMKGTNRSLSRTQSSKPRSKSFKYQKASKAKSVQESVPTKENRNDSLTALSTDSKRRRTDAAEYIKKRFLYDVDDEPKRFKSRKSRSIRLSAAIVPASRKPRLPGKHDWRTGSPSEDGMLPLRSRRGRRVKPKQDYSPLSYENKKSPPYVPEDNVPLRRTARRKGRRSRRPEIPPEPEVHQRRSTWELPDLFNADDNDQMDDLSQTESYSNDAHKQRFPDTTELPNYSDVLLDDIPNRTNILGGSFEEHDRRRLALREHMRRSDPRKMHHRHPASPDVPKGTNSFHRRTLLSPGLSSDAETHLQNTLDFGTDQVSGNFGRRREFDEFDHTEDEYVQSSGSRAPSEEPNQAHEELEEELLAPELSLLTGQTDNGVVPPGPLSNCSGSRRKSPVRPMQVLRTKSHSSANGVAQAPVLVSTSDENPFIFHSTMTNASTYNRQLPTSEEYSSAVFQPTIMEKNLSDQAVGEVHFGLKAASILRLPSSTNAGASAIAIRSIPEHTLQLPVSTECSSSSPGPPSLLPSVLNQGNARAASQPVTRMFPGASPTNRPVTSMSAKSLLSHSTSAASRRRPTILKRGGVSGTASVASNVFASQRHADVEETVVSIPVPRTIGAFTSSSVHKPAAVVQVSTATTTQSPNAPAKLLQLVTTPSISAPQLATNLTASDKLFGRRPGGPVTLPHGSVPVSGTGSTFVDVTEAQTNTIHPYRYAVLRGSSYGKRYLVLGNQGIFDRNSNSVNSALAVLPGESLASDRTEAADAVQSRSIVSLGTHTSELVSEALDREENPVQVDETIETDQTPALRAHLQPSFTFSTSLSASNAPSVAAI